MLLHRDSRRVRRTAALIGSALAVAAPVRPRTGQAERTYAAELLPESATPMPPIPASRRAPPWHAVLTFIVDTTGRVEPGSVRVLEADDSATAQVVRAAVPGLRYRPERIVDADGPCAIYNRTLVTCGGVHPGAHLLRSREVLQVSILPPGAQSW